MLHYKTSIRRQAACFLLACQAGHHGLVWAADRPCRILAALPLAIALHMHAVLLHRTARQMELCHSKLRAYVPQALLTSVVTCLGAKQGDKGSAGRISHADVAAACVEAMHNPAARNMTLELKEVAGKPAGSDSPRYLLIVCSPMPGPLSDQLTRPSIQNTPHRSQSLSAGISSGAFCRLA